MNLRSVRFRLLALYGVILLAVYVAFGAYAYAHLRRYAYAVLERSLWRRANYLVTAVLRRSAEEAGEPGMAEEVALLYGPELNDRFIRISRLDGGIVYASGPPSDKSFDPFAIPRIPVPPGSWKMTFVDSEELLLLSKPFEVRGASYLVEVGVSARDAELLVGNFVLTLGLALPVLLLLAVSGGAVLVNRALAPVDRAIAAAREITFQNFSRRLPIPGTGDEIDNLSVALNEMIDRLEVSFQHAARFTADASHELRTPLTVMRGELEAMIQDTTLSHAHRAAAGSVLEEVVRLARIVNDLLVIGRLEAGEAQLERSRFDLQDMVATTVEQIALLAEEKGVHVRWVGQEPLEVEGDPYRLKQVVVNLLDNAIKYTPPGGEVWLQTRRDDGRGVMQIRDTGPGIPEAALPRVFDRFFRVDPTRSGEGGTGLGLAIVKQICAAHGGSVVIENDPAGGCRVSVSLPLAPVPTVTARVGA